MSFHDDEAIGWTDVINLRSIVEADMLSSS